MEQHHAAIAGISIGCLAVFGIVAFLTALLVVPIVAVLSIVHAFLPGDHPELPAPPRLAAYYGQVADGYGVFWQHLAAWDGATNRFQIPIPTEDQIFQQLYQDALDARERHCEELPPENRKRARNCNPPHLSDDEIKALHRQAHRQWVRNLLDYIEPHARALRQQGATRDDQHSDRPDLDWRPLVGKDLEERAQTLAMGYSAEESLEDAPDLLYPSNPADADFIPDPDPDKPFVWPAQAPVLTHYGYRYVGSPPHWRLHPGIDLDLPSGAQVTAARAGQVSRAGDDPTYGRLVVIDSGDGYSTWYACQCEIDVSQGAQVAAGQAIARVASAGKPALHLEVRVQGVPHNPMLFLP